MNRKNGVFDLYSIDTNGATIRVDHTKQLINNIANKTDWRERILQVQRQLNQLEDKANVPRTVITVINKLYTGKNVPSENEQKMQERIIAERKRMVTGV